MKKNIDITKRLSSEQILLVRPLAFLYNRGSIVLFL